MARRRLAARLILEDVVVAVDDHHTERQAGEHRLERRARRRQRLGDGAGRGGCGPCRAHARQARPRRDLRRPQVRDRGPAPAPHVDLGAALVGDEDLAERARRLGPAQREDPPLAKREGEELEHAPLELGVEVDEHVAADDEIDARERGPLGEVVLAEHDAGPEPLLDLVTAVREPQEVLRHALLREARERRGGIDALPGLRDRLRVDVRREDPDARGVQRLAEEIGEEDHDRVRLLPRRAAGRPDPQFVAPGGGAGDELGEDAIAERREKIRIPHEFGHLDQEAIDELGLLLHVLVEVACIALEPVRARGHDALPYAPLERRRLVGAEVDPAPLPHTLEDACERALVFAAHDRLGRDALEERP